MWLARGSSRAFLWATGRGRGRVGEAGLQAQLGPGSQLGLGPGSQLGLGPALQGLVERVCGG